MTISQQLKTALLSHGHTICVAESLTGGNLQAAITSVSGSSAYFEGGVTAYNLAQKVALLGVEREHAEKVDCVSQRVAEEMARGVRKLFGASVAAATTGYAEPFGEVAEPFAFFAVDIQGHVTAGRVAGPGLERIAMQRHVTRHVLERMVELLASG